MPLPAGTRLGPYEIVSALGAGAMGEVYRARDTRLGRDVALKVVSGPLARDPDNLRRLEEEAKAASALSHPNITAVYDVGADGGSPYVVSELLEGQTLRERLAPGRLPVRKCLDYARQIAAGLSAAHEKDIVHRDLKPENVFVTRDGRVKILDFGLAKLSEPVGPATDTDTLGRLVGTVGYMSPEQVKGGAADPRSDIFSFGVVLYEMLAGRRPFSGATAVDTMNAILHHYPSALVGLPPGLERILWHCLEKEPDERFQSARDLAFDLGAVDESTTSGLVRIGAPVTARRRAFVLAAVLLAGMALGAGAFAYLTRRPVAASPAFQRLTFRRGSVESARFAPDAQTIVYSGAWNGQPVELFSTRRDSPESRAFGLASADLLAVSRAGEMAVSLQRHRLNVFVASGVLTRMPLAGGAPRPLQEDVQHADWAPDGGLAVVRSVGGRNRLEYPTRKVLVETAGWVSNPRFSREGSAIAYLDHPVWGDDGANVAVVDLAGRTTTLSRGWASAQGLAWSPAGDEVWFTGTRDGVNRALVAVRRDGIERTLYRVPGSMTLHDVSADGSVLIAHNITRREIVGRSAGSTEERELTWLDYSFPAAITPDGKAVFFAENGEGGGRGYSLYHRTLDGGTAVRLGEGAAMALSPDGRWALSNVDYTSGQPQLTLWPIGAGQPRRLPTGGLNAQAATFFPDGRRILILANAPGEASRCYVQDLETGRPQPLGPPGLTFALATQPITPDGSTLLLRASDGVYVFVPVDGGDQRKVPGLEPGEQPIRFTGDGAALFAYHTAEMPARVTRIDLATGRRQPWLEIRPSDPAGVFGLHPVLLSADGRAYVYGYRRVLSDLYLLTGLGARTAGAARAE